MCFYIRWDEKKKKNETFALYAIFLVQEIMWDK